MGPNTFNPNMIKIIWGAAGVGTGAIFLALAMLAVTPRLAGATPAFAQQTGMPCAQCHANPAGGGKLTDFGEKFKANGNKLPGK